MRQCESWAPESAPSDSSETSEGKTHTFKKVGVRHREDKSFDKLDLSCLKTSCGVAENRQVRFAWPGQRSILYAVLKLYYFYAPEEYLADPVC